ncbi:MAG TPA: bile acid:sodium symporter [Limosilactobacillus reuteri]|nr:bile acid:sodium symporter [Limosilactobacillus reuteri]
MSTSQNGLKHWKLHLTILMFTFVLFPIVGLALRPLVASINKRK